VPANPALASAIERLPGRKLVFTNGTVAHAEKVMTRLGITGHFHGIFDIVHADYIPKPALGPYEKFARDHSIEPSRAAMFEDIARNLEVPHRLGMTTVLVCHASNEDAQFLNRRHRGGDSEFVDHVTEDLASFLDEVIAARAGSTRRSRKQANTPHPARSRGSGNP
jgi:putative hydrolase of the HAD superfamily